jgi:hypothetical protein
MKGTDKHKLCGAVVKCVENLVDAKITYDSNDSEWSNNEMSKDYPEPFYVSNSRKRYEECKTELENALCTLFGEAEKLKMSKKIVVSECIICPFQSGGICTKASRRLSAVSLMTNCSEIPQFCPLEENE